MLRPPFLLCCLWGLIAGRAVARIVVRWRRDRRASDDYRRAREALERLEAPKDRTVTADLAKVDPAPGLEASRW